MYKRELHETPHAPNLNGPRSLGPEWLRLSRVPRHGETASGELFHNSLLTAPVAEAIVRRLRHTSYLVLKCGGGWSARTGHLDLAGT